MAMRWTSSRARVVWLRRTQTNLGGEYGNSDFDVRHTFNGYIVYEVPKFTEQMKLLTRGWQGNAFITAFTGTPVAVKLGVQTTAEPASSRTVRTRSAIRRPE